MSHSVFHCLQIDHKSIQDWCVFKYFKQPFPELTSFLCITTAVTRWHQYSSHACCQTIPYPAALPTFWEFASCPNLPLMLRDPTHQKLLPCSSQEHQLHMENKVTENARKCNASLPWNLCGTQDKTCTFPNADMFCVSLCHLLNTHASHMGQHINRKKGGILCLRSPSKSIINKQYCFMVFYTVTDSLVKKPNQK